MCADGYYMEKIMTERFFIENPAYLGKQTVFNHIGMNQYR